MCNQLALNADTRDRRPAILPQGPYKKPNKVRKTLPKGLPVAKKKAIRRAHGQRASQDLRDRKKRYEIELYTTVEHLQRESRSLDRKLRNLNKENETLLANLGIPVDLLLEQFESTEGPPLPPPMQSQSTGPQDATQQAFQYLTPLSQKKVPVQLLGYNDYQQFNMFGDDGAGPNYTTPTTTSDSASASSAEDLSDIGYLELLATADTTDMQKDIFKMEDDKAQASWESF